MSGIQGKNGGMKKASTPSFFYKREELPTVDSKQIIFLLLGEQRLPLPLVSVRRGRTIVKEMVESVVSFLVEKSSNLVVQEASLFSQVEG